MKKNEKLNLETAEITTISKEQLNVVIHKEYRRPDGSLAVEWDYSNCPSMAEQHTAHLTDINYLMEKYQPDELAAYIAARSQYRTEILGHDFSKEPDLQTARNWVLTARHEFDKLPDDVRSQFKNHIEFLKFIDNPLNQKKMVKLGLLTSIELEKLKLPDSNQQPDPKSTNQTQNQNQTKN